MRLSVLVPVYNERTMVERSLAQVLAVPLPEDMERELIVVDDCSTDGTWEILARLAARHPEIRLIRHEVNQGKGAAVRTAIQHATGDFALIQDADLEYDPADYPLLLKPLLEGHADAVYGSRYMAGQQRRVLPFWHSMTNKGLTLACNMLSNLHLTDMETCYKAFRTDLLKSIPLRTSRFGIDPELTIKAAKRKFRIYEVPVSYHGRTYEEGKKIGWKDGLVVLGTMLRFWAIDDLYCQPYGRGLLNNLTGTPQYLNWVAGLLRPHVGDTVLEIGAGIGSFAARLMGRRYEYVVAEKDPLYLHALNNRFLRTPNVRAVALDPARAADFAGLEASFDTVLCLNVLEYLGDPAAAVAAFAGALRPGGRLLVLVPQGPALHGPIDRTLGHLRRYRLQDVRRLVEQAGLQVEQAHSFNKVGALAWALYGGLLRRRSINKLSLKIFDKTVWLWRRIDPLLPWPGLSLVVVARKPG